MVSILIIFSFFGAVSTYAAVDYSKGLLDGKPIDWVNFRGGAPTGTQTSLVTDGNLDSYVVLDPYVLSYTFPGAVDAENIKIRYRVDGGSDNALVVTILYADGSTNLVRLVGSTVTDGVIPLTKPLKKFTLSKSNGFNRYIYELNVFGIPDTTPPAMPTGFTGTAGDSTVTLNFGRNTETDFSHYVLYTDGVPKKYLDAEVNLEKTNSRKILLTGLVNGKKYTFQLSAVDQDGNESKKTVGMVLTPNPPPPPDTTPPEVPELQGQAGNGMVTLRWTESSDEDISGFIVYQDGKQITKLGNLTSYVVKRLENGRKYSFTVSAYDLTGNESAQSNLVVIAPQNVMTDTEQETGPDYLLVKWSKTEGAIGYRIYLNGRLISSVGPTVFEYKITRAMGYIPGVISNKAEARAILADGSEGGSNNPTAPVLELADGYGVGDAFKAGIEFVKLLNGWVLIALAIVLANMMIAFLYLLNKKYKITQRG
ncbi:fibronectin type III domain-containing protein [Paenibacillus sp. EKM102P]|uniref:fibronectin type III domain-containing protein n=1 Tax=unclassified Paenibacillus TaxID=185978 RepID=UPI00142DA161|nr:MULTISPECIES: fibronectin type III domain-containing protein [unclassified Paenibacillus]KAF6614217.1 fibronectin type III domain-containing protein [Paenibacillus sp. EKM101P]KAF6616575.1 fibronectin type III domain-containing protein [Paenibacillus sp. EKM102P]KAF6625051.1 fibronectin type III domain-containing protein [Paenibacillus sp. EKM10P]KAF6640888.1 fibronectin type III domain-containing protein [Paenibacillus sp. EKM11P]